MKRTRHAGADRVCAEAGGDGHGGGRGDLPDGDLEADVLPLVKGVRWAGRRRTAAPEAALGGNRKLERLVADLSLDKHVLAKSPAA